MPSRYINEREIDSMTKEDLAVVKLFRFDPEVDTRPSYREYKVPYRGRTVLDVLLYIYQNMDSTFTFRWACAEGLCRSCAVSVNGRPALACNAPARKEMKIDPHPKFKLKKDLLVDLDSPQQ